ncbi:hypothetical protein ACQ4LE_004857 [Meloidogyne hapla]
MTTKRNFSTTTTSPEAVPTKRQQFIEAISSLNFDTLQDDNTISAPARAIISQLSSLLKTAACLIEEISSPNSIQAAIATHLEEDKRLRSVVVANLPESTTTTHTSRALADQEQVYKMLDVCEMDTLPTASFRMGTRDPKNGMKSRLLKIVFPTKGAARTFLRSKKKLATNQMFARVHVRESLTLAQRAERQGLIMECKKKRDETKEDYIVYANHVILRSDISKFRQGLNLHN